MVNVYFSLLILVLSFVSCGAISKQQTKDNDDLAHQLNKTENSFFGIGSAVTDEGAWCWFADPRAVHHKSSNGKINNTYIGYIDVHGNIKAMQYNFNTKNEEEVLVRSYFQPDDHNNPTFLVLPDDRIMIFYSRHTDEPCFYYRVSQLPGDITTLGKENKIKTEHNTTYPSPFILSEDPNHIYLCWRGIKWHPTIAKLSLPDTDDNVDILWGPHQIVQSTGARPYAKYASNGEDKLLITYTTGHPDNEWPNYLHYSYIDIKTLELKDVNGSVLSNLKQGPFNINKTKEFVEEYSTTVIDNSQSRNWVWQITHDKMDNPIVAMVRINQDKTKHTYYYVKWNGVEWDKTFLVDAGAHFHQTPHHEMCYSGGLAIDSDSPETIYCSVPKEGMYGEVYELLKISLNDNNKIVSKEFVTKDSPFNNIRPYVIPNSINNPLRLVWMHGDYYDWIVSSKWQQGFPTAIHSNFAGFTAKDKDIKSSPALKDDFIFIPKKDLDFTVQLKLDVHNYEGSLLEVGELSYYLNGETLKPEIRYNNKVYPSSNVLGNSAIWKDKNRGTGGQWYEPTKFKEFTLRIKYQKGVLTTYVNGLIDQYVVLEL